MYIFSTKKDPINPFTASQSQTSCDHLGHSSSSPQEAMELLYIWINEDETGFIQQQGFNFSPNYRFEMKSYEDGKYELFCAENLRYPNVWKINNIVNLTAVVGENGSGKTALLGHLERTTLFPIILEKRSEYLTLRNERNRKHRTLLIYGCNSSICIYHNFPSDVFTNKTTYKDININDQDYNKIAEILSRQTRVYMTNGSAYSCSVEESRGHVSKMVFSAEGNKALSQIFYGKKTALRTNTRSSTNFLALQKLIASCKSSTDFEQLVAINYYHYLLSNDSLRSSSLLSNNRRICVNIRNPFPEFEKLYKGIGGKDFHSDDQFIQKVSDGMNIYGRWMVALAPDVHMDLVTKAYLYLIFELQFLTDSAFLPLKTMDEDIEADNADTLHNRAYALLQKYKSNVDYDEVILRYYSEAIDEIDELHKILDTCPTVVNYVPPIDSAYRTNILIQQEDNPESYRHFCGYVNKLMQKEMSFLLKYIDIYMPPLSSGEQALQNILSWLRLTPSYEDILSCNSIPIHDNVLLLLDEVDLYMHPEWQRKFLKYLSDELALEYPDKHIQIIISTHSPLVLSDIPSGNIIYLEKNDKKCTIAQRSDQKESFGANIFSLLKDSFFLKKSLGEFAYSRISEVIKDLEKLKKHPQDQELQEKCKDYCHLIDIIGEPLLRRKLQMMYDDLFRGDADDSAELALEKVEHLLKSDVAKYRERLMKMLSDAESK